MNFDHENTKTRNKSCSVESSESHLAACSARQTPKRIAHFRSLVISWLTFFLFASFALIAACTGGSGNSNNSSPAPATTTPASTSSPSALPKHIEERLDQLHNDNTIAIDKLPALTIGSTQTRQINLIFALNMEGFFVDCGCTAAQVGGLSRIATIAKALPGESVVVFAGRSFAPKNTGYYVALRMDNRIKRLSTIAARREATAVWPALPNFALIPEQIEYTFIANKLEEEISSRTTGKLTLQLAGQEIPFPVSVNHIVNDKTRTKYLVTPYPVPRTKLEVERSRGRRLVVVSFVTTERVAWRAEDHPNRTDKPPAQVGFSEELGEVLRKHARESLQVQEVTRGKRSRDAVLAGVQALVAATTWSIDVVEDIEPDSEIESAIADAASSIFHDLSLADEAPTALGDHFGKPENASCGECHSARVEHWKTTRHAHALETLRLSLRHKDPRCLTCHTTPMLLGGDLPSVSCSRCHKSEDGAHRKLLDEAAINALCGECHTDASDPHGHFKKALHTICQGGASGPSGNGHCPR